MKCLALVLLFLGVVHSQAEAQGTPPGITVSPRLLNELMIDRCSRVIGGGSHADEGALLGFLEKARGYISSGHYEEALDDAERVVAAKPDSAVALIYRAIIFHAMKKWRRATKDLDDAISVTDTPPSIMALAYYIRAEYWLGENKRALKDASTAISINPNLAPAYSFRGHLLSLAMKYDAAEEDFDRGVLLDPESTYGYIMRSNHSYSRGSVADAIRDIDRAIALDPKNPLAYWLRGRIYFYEGDRRAADRDFERADELFSPYEAQ